MDAWHFWIILGFIFLIIEIFTPAFFFASMGIGAFLAGIGAYCGVSFTLQLLLLALGTLLVFVGVRPFLKMFQTPDPEGVKTGVAALIGKSAVVLEPIDNLTHTGRVKIGGEEWKAYASDDTQIPAGSVVIVEKIEGVKVIVALKTEKEK